MKTETQEALLPREQVERNPVPVVGPAVSVVRVDLVRLQVPGFRTGGKTPRHREAPWRSAYRKSLISSTPCLTKGAADHPTKIPERARSNVASMSTRAIMNSQ